MTLEAIRLAVDQHACHVLGTRYGFVLKWAAVERHTDPAQARYLLNVELVTAPGGVAPGPQLLVQISQLSELTALLDDALYHELADQLIVQGAKVSRSPLELGLAIFPSAALRAN